jgi:hypothetical protein
VLLGCKHDILRVMSLLIILWTPTFKSGEISFLQIRSCNNHENLLTRSLSFTIFDKCVKWIDMRSLKDLQGSGGEAL